MPPNLHAFVARSLVRVSPGFVAVGFLLSALSWATAQSTWTGATGGEWGTAGNWSGGVPNAIGATANINSALTVNVSDTGTGGTYPYTFGTLASSLASGSVVVGNNTVTTDQLTAQVSSGTPTINVANGNANIFYYANLLGSQGFNKTGSGKLTFRFNGADQAYTGNLTITAGVLGINQNGSLGDDNNDLTIANGARLLAEPGSNTGTITLPSTRVITLSGAQSQIGASPAAVTLVVQGNVTESGTGQGLVKTDAGKLTLAGTVSYTGETRIAGGTLALSGSAALPSGQNLRFNSAAATLDVGGTAQIVRTIVMDVTTANRTFTGGGSLTVNGDANLQLSASNAVAYDFAGLNSFTFNRSARQFNLQNVNGASITSLNDFYLAKSGGSGGVNTVTASQVLVGAGDSTGNNGNTSRLHLGTQNTFNSPLFQIGGFNAGGIVDFQPGLTAPFLKLRGADGSSAMGTLKIGETSSGTRRGEGVLNLAGGSLDALVTDTIIGRHVAGANLADTSSLTVPDGALTTTTLLLAEKTGTGTPTLTATLTQGGGTVKAQSVTMGKDAGGGAMPVLKPTYNLNGGTLFAGSMDGGTGAFDTTSSERVLNLNGGTLRNYDSATDLTVDGVDATAAGRLNLVVGAGGGTIHADPSRKVTFTGFTRLAGSGALAKNGDGTLLVNGDGSAYTGTLTVTAGTLGGTGTLGGAVTVNTGGTLAPGASIGTLTLNNTVTLSGTTSMEINKAGPTLTSDQIAGATSIGAGGTLNVAASGDALTGGESFTIFNVTPGGSFAAVNLPALGAGLNWFTANNYRTLTVNRAPVALAQSFSIAQGDTGNLTVIGGKHPPTDADSGETLTVTAVGAVSPGSAGTAGFNSSGVSFAAANNFSGTATFSYTVSDGRGGSDSTQLVTVTVTPAASGANLALPAFLTPGVATLNGFGIPGHAYQLQYTVNLNPVNWQDVTGPLATAAASVSNGTLSLVDTNASGPSRFYRTRHVP